MIYVNHEKKAIFIHIPKTGGSYIGPTLVAYYGFTSYLDIINQKRPDHELYCMPTNNNQTPNQTHVKTGIHAYDNSFFNKEKGLVEYCITSDEIMSKMGLTQEQWNSYMKFCFIRHPYDRIMSGWKHINAILNPLKTFDTYIHNNPLLVSDIEYAHVFMSQKRWIQDTSGCCSVNIIGRFEHLEHDFVSILRRIGFTNIIHRPKKVNSTSTSSNTKSLEMSYKSILRVNQLMQDDLQTFHYKAVI